MKMIEYVHKVISMLYIEQFLNFEFQNFLSPFYQVFTLKLGNIAIKYPEIQNSDENYIINIEMTL